MNFAHHSDPEYHKGYSDIPNKVDITHLDVSDFFEDADGKLIIWLVMEMFIPISIFPFQHTIALF